MLYYVSCDVEYNKKSGKLIKKCRFKECKKVKGIRIDRRKFDDPSKIEWEPDRATWYTQGTNHRVVDGMITRDIEEEFYVIEINTLEDVLNFQEKYKTNAMPSINRSSYIYNGEELNNFYTDFIME